MKTNTAYGIYDFSDYAEEITGSDLFLINGGGPSCSGGVQPTGSCGGGVSGTSSGGSTNNGTPTGTTTAPTSCSGGTSATGTPANSTTGQPATGNDTTQPEKPLNQSVTSGVPSCGGGTQINQNPQSTQNTYSSSDVDSHESGDIMPETNTVSSSLTPQQQYEMAEKLKREYADSLKKNWNSYYQEKYKEYVAVKISEYELKGYQFTCEDLALSVLIDFAYENELPLRIKNKSGTYDIKKYDNIEEFKKKVLTTTAANDLMKNTIPIVPTVITKGDLVLMDTGIAGGKKDGIMSHTQVVVNNYNGELIIKQGNLSVEAKRKHGAGDYGGQYYGGQPIQQRRLDFINDIFHGKEKPVPEATSAYGINYRRWDFNAW